MMSVPCPQCGTQTQPGVVCASCGTPTPAPGGEAQADPYVRQWEAIQARLEQATAPKYVVKSLLGYGGMAGVYLADEPRLRRKVAIKVMAPWLMVDPRLVERFEQEARTTAQLSHPNIVTIYEVDERDDLHWFAMTYVPGRTLGQVLSEDVEPLPIAVTCAWLQQIGSALAFAHSRGIVHRDIKPGNVLIDLSGNALITDFGIAKVTDSEAGLTRTGTLVGTPTYMSPEQCTASEIGGASDQYSLGAVAYQMLTGRPPFSGPTLTVVQAHLSNAPTPILELRPDCPARLADAVERMLAKVPEERWENVSAAIEGTGAQSVSLESIRTRLRLLATPTAAVQGALPANVREGSRTSLSLQLLDATGRALPARTLHWTSTNPAIARATPDNTLHAFLPGQVTLTAISGPATLTATVQVTADALRALTLREPLPLEVGETRPLQMEVFDLQEKRLADRAVLLSSSNPNVANVTADGVVQGVAAGTAKIIARSGGRVAETTVVVKSAQRRTVHTSQPSTMTAAQTRAAEPLSVVSSSRPPDQAAGVGAIGKAFRRHLTLAARLQAGANLTSSSQEPATADQLRALLADAEQRSGFVAAQQSADPADFESAEYAVNAFIDQEARARFKDAWKPRNPDPHVATSFYRRLLNRRKTARSTPARDEVAEIYALCLLLGFRGDPTLHESVDVRATLREVVRRSGEVTTALQSQEFTPLGYDARIVRAHRFARLALLGLLIVWLASLVLGAVLR